MAKLKTKNSTRIFKKFINQKTLTNMNLIRFNNKRNQN